MHKRSSLPILLVLIGVLLIVLAACGAPAEETQVPSMETEAPEPTEPPPPTEEPQEPAEVVISGSASTGGLLYDKWWKVVGLDEPADDQPLWATQSTNTREGSTTWRCKECHGWDYKGADGAYGSGSHFTGFPGVLDAAQSMEPAELLAVLDGSANPDHDFSIMGEKALGDLVVFLKDGLVDVSSYIDADTKAAVGGDSTLGEEFFTTACTACHGADGRILNFGDEEEPEYVGTIAIDNPWEFIHKVRAGQPGTAMPSAMDSGWSIQDVVSVLTYAQSLPTEAPLSGSASTGGRLYDKWWKEAGVDEPTENNPIWARQETNTREGSTTWRCKECHGWDYMGVDGAYGSGSHFTGFPGVFGAQAKSFDELIAQLTGGVDPEHDFSAMGDSALADLVSFLKGGLVDVSPYIDPDTKAVVGGDSTLGEELFTTTCTACHGADGRMLNFGDEEEPEYVGTIAIDNPWEFIHKVQFGQPGTAMPSAMDSGWSFQNLLDLLAFAQSLPLEAP